MQAGDEAIDRRTLPFKSAVVILLKVDISALGRESFRKAENEVQAHRDRRVEGKILHRAMKLVAQFKAISGIFRQWLDRFHESRMPFWDFGEVQKLGYRC